ncbi:sugar kinase [Haloferax mucosum ATCC BAA-1512]|uniref:Sugar kinase n=2 Tax=Haloferax mucosum TaxID=403181 RepID=M0IH24_9EURY|nr:sugar kinase [Haloferax mucosum ATCC BAA-1512]
MEHGRAVPAVTADEMRDVDRVAVETVGLGLLQMMEHGRADARGSRPRSGGSHRDIGSHRGDGRRQKHREHQNRRTRPWVLTRR